MGLSCAGCLPRRVDYGWCGVAGVLAVVSCAFLIYYFVRSNHLTSWESWEDVRLREVIFLLLALVAALALSKVVAIGLHLLEFFCQVRRVRALVSNTDRVGATDESDSVRTVLICHASVGAGHRRAAEAVSAALADLDKEVTIKVVDLMDPKFADGALVYLYKDWYLRMVGGESFLGALGGHFMAFMFDRTNSVQAFTGGTAVQRRLTQSFLVNFLQLVVEVKPDVIVHTHFLAPELLASLRRRHDLRVPHVTVVTDMDVHAWWYQQPTEHYFVARTFAADQLHVDGVPQMDITVSGIPIMPQFLQTVQALEGMDRRQRRSRQLRRMDAPLGEAFLAAATARPDEAPVRHLVIQMSTGKNTREIYRQLLLLETPILLVVVCGRQADVRDDLQKIAAPERHNVAFVGFTRTLHELMAAADIIVTKPGGLITAEAFSCGLMTVVVDPYAGQEERNSSTILEVGAGIRVWDMRDLPAKLDPVLAASAGRDNGDGVPTVEDYKARAKSLGRPEAAFTVARYVLSGEAGRRMRKDYLSSESCLSLNGNACSDDVAVSRNAVAEPPEAAAAGLQSIKVDMGSEPGPGQGPLSESVKSAGSYEDPLCGWPRHLVRLFPPLQDIMEASSRSGEPKRRLSSLRTTSQMCMADLEQEEFDAVPEDSLHPGSEGAARRQEDRSCAR